MDLIIFDCDGVLVDSEVISCRVDAEAFTEAGFPTTVEYVAANYVGHSVKSMLADIEARHGKKLPPNFAELLLRRTQAAFEGALEAVPGIHSVLESNGVARCVASSSRPERIRHSLELTDLLHHFEPHLFSAQMVDRGKPAPDLFLFAAERMDVTPGRCVVVEDSVAGVTAAAAAGMTTIGFTAAGHCPPDLADRLRSVGANEIAADAASLREILAQFAAAGVNAG